MTVEGWDAMRAAREADGRVARDEAAERAARAAKPRATSAGLRRGSERANTTY